MKIEKDEAILTQDEVREAVCPRNLRWVLGMYSMFGLEKKFKSELLEGAKKCPEVLRALGYRVKIVEKEE
jgi:hypothetical protein